MQTFDHYTPHITAAIEGGLDFAALRSALDDGITKLFDHPRFAEPKRILFTGSGDSMFAAISALPAFRRWTGLAAQSLSAIDFARYEVPLLDPADVVFGVSNSGSASRTREAVTLARAKGNLTVGITGSLKGPLAELADVVLYRPVSAPSDVDPTLRRVYLNMVEYLVAMYAVYYVGLRIGVQRGRLTEAEAEGIREAIELAMRRLPDDSATMEPAIAQIASELQSCDTIWTIGAGPNFGTARYCSAKYHEQLPLNGIAEDLEEWAHLQYFLTLFWKQRSVVFVLAPPGNSLDRAEELVEGIHRAGGRAIVAAHPQHGSFPNAALRLDITSPEDEWLTPISYHLPTQLLVLHLLRYYDLPFTPLARADDYWLIRKGIVRTSPQGLA